MTDADTNVATSDPRPTVPPRAAATPRLVRYVLIDETDGAACANSDKVDALALARIAEALALQLNGEFADEYGGAATVRVGLASNILPGERAVIFKATLPEAPGASAYHDVDGRGVPFAFCAVTTCADLFGHNGVSVDVSHEGIETNGDEGCNLYALGPDNVMHSHEVADPVETQTYEKTLSDGTRVHVSNFVLRAFFIPGASGPYDYMTKAGLANPNPPPGPLQTAPSTDGQGNYQLVGPGPDAPVTPVFADGKPASRVHVVGHPKNPDKVKHWSSRACTRQRLY
jgi:hypothetical protein